MKANELMIGDWVQINEPDLYAGAHGTICSLIHHHSNDGVYFHVFVQDKGVVLREVFNEDLLPIPLTKEILEKNFEVHRQFATFTEYWLDIPRKWVRVALNSYIEIYNGENKNVHIDGKVYVHELQHALRLCGIDKEIVL